MGRIKQRLKYPKKSKKHREYLRRMQESRLACRKKGSQITDNIIHNSSAVVNHIKSDGTALPASNNNNNTTIPSTAASHSIEKQTITNSPWYSIAACTIFKPMMSTRAASKIPPLTFNSNTTEIPNLKSNSMFEVKVRGRRIVEFDYFFRILKIANQHSKSGFCNLNDLVITNEWKKGLSSSYYLKCTMCYYQIHLNSERPLKDDINADTAVAMVSLNINFKVMSKLLSKMNLPPLSSAIFNKECEKISCHLEPNATRLSKTVTFFKGAITDDVKNDLDSQNQVGLGRRIIEFDYFFKMLRKINQHSTNGCNLNDISIISEKRIGLQSIFFLNCTVCDYKVHLNSENSTENKNINTDIIEGMVSANANFSVLNRLLFKMDLIAIPHTFLTKDCDELNNSSCDEPYRSVNYVTVRLQNSQEIKKQEIQNDLNGIVVEDQFEIKEERSEPEYGDSCGMVFPQAMEIKTPSDKLNISQDSIPLNEIEIKQEILSDDEEIKQEILSDDEELTGAEASENDGTPHNGSFEYYDLSELILIQQKQINSETSVNKIIVDKGQIILDEVEVKQEAQDEIVI